MDSEKLFSLVVFVILSITLFVLLREGISMRMRCEYACEDQGGLRDFISCGGDAGRLSATCKRPYKYYCEKALGVCLTTTDINGTNQELNQTFLIFWRTHYKRKSL